jgi:hypothetical protein
MYWEDPFSQGESYRAPAEKAQFEAEITRHIEVGALSALPSACYCAAMDACMERYFCRKLLSLAVKHDVSCCSATWYHLWLRG